MMLCGSGISADLVWMSCIDTSSSPCPSPGDSMKKDSHCGVGGPGNVSVRRSAWMICARTDTKRGGGSMDGTQGMSKKRLCSSVGWRGVVAAWAGYGCEWTAEKARGVGGRLMEEASRGLEATNRTAAPSVSQRENGSKQQSAGRIDGINNTIRAASGSKNTPQRPPT